MKNIQKIAIVVSLVAFGSIGCSNASNQELSSETENQEMTSELSTQEIPYETENPEIASEMSTPELPSETVNPEMTSEVSTQEMPSDFSYVLENPVPGQQVTLQGKVVGEMDDCYIFTDGTNKILLHFDEPEIAYDPNQIVEISGVIEDDVIHEAHGSEEAKYSNLATDTTIMVTQMRVIDSGEKS